MTEAALGAALTQAAELERAARAHWQAAETLAERDAALRVVRHATAVIVSLKDWIATRAQALAPTT
jgi:hypothetical protein